MENKERILKVYFRGNKIYTREVNKLTDKGFYNTEGKIIANGKVVIDYEDWFLLIKSEIKSRERDKKIRSILK